MGKHYRHNKGAYYTRPCDQLVPVKHYLHPVQFIYVSELLLSFLDDPFFIFDCKGLLLLIVGIKGKYSISHIFLSFLAFES